MMTSSSFALHPGQRWLENLSRIHAPALRLFCFPYAGGSMELYRTWRRWLPDQLDTCLVHLPGRGRNVRERAFTRLTLLVNAVANRMEHQTNVPYALYGHSMGALIAFELARELFRRGRPGPQHLFVSGRRAPHLPAIDPPIFNLPHEEFLSELKKLNGTPQEVIDNPELMGFFINTLRADFEVVETYEYRSGEPLPCPISVYGGLQDLNVPMPSYHAWQQQTSASCSVKMFEGDHFFIRNPSPEFIGAFRNDLLSAALPTLP